MLKAIYIVSTLAVILAFLGFVQEVREVVLWKHPHFVPPKPSASQMLSAFASMIFLCFCPVFNTVAVLYLTANHDKMLEITVEKFEDKFDLR